MKLAINVTYTRTLQMSATGTATVSATITAESEAGDEYDRPEDVAAITAMLWPMARAAVREQVITLIEEKRVAHQGDQNNS